MITEDELSVCGAKVPEGKILVNDGSLINMFQQLILRSTSIRYWSAQILNGDYLPMLPRLWLADWDGPRGNIPDHLALLKQLMEPLPSMPAKIRSIRVRCCFLP